MANTRRSYILSFCIGGLIGGGITLLLTRSLAKNKNVGTGRRDNVRNLHGEMRERHYENGIYCAPEGADMHYDLEDGLYYSTR